MRIAKGSGRTVTEVNQLVDRFFEARKMMGQLARGGGLPGMPGMPGMPGLGGKAGKQKAQPKKGKGARRSGNPAKAAQAATAEAEKRAAANPFGNPGGEEIDYEKAAAALDLPKDFSQFLK